MSIWCRQHMNIQLTLLDKADADDHEKTLSLHAPNNLIWKLTAVGYLSFNFLQLYGFYI